MERFTNLRVILAPLSSWSSGESWNQSWNRSANHQPYLFQLCSSFPPIPEQDWPKPGTAVSHFSHVSTWPTSCVDSGHNVSLSKFALLFDDLVSIFQCNKNIWLCFWIVAVCLKLILRFGAHRDRRNAGERIIASHRPEFVCRTDLHFGALFTLFVPMFFQFLENA